MELMTASLAATDGETMAGTDPAAGTPMPMPMVQPSGYGSIS